MVAEKIKFDKYLSITITRIMIENGIDSNDDNRIIANEIHDSLYGKIWSIKSIENSLIQRGLIK